MKYSIITLFPELIETYCNTSIIGRATKNHVITVDTVNPRDFTTDNYRSVDDTPYGGGTGMVMMCDPVFKAVENIQKTDTSCLILTTPQGKPYNQELARELTNNHNHLIIICGHYEGVDERIRTGLKPLEISLGDFILTGGELAALCIIDSTARLVSGVIGKHEAIHEESFNNWLLEYPHYTRPAEYREMKVPDILLSGHHKNIEEWRKQQSIIRTYEKRPDLLPKSDLSEKEVQFLRDYISSKNKE